MRTPKRPTINLYASIAVILAALALLPACSVNVKDHGDDGNSKVDIDTPVGGIHVDENADARDTGIPVYPGARKKADTDDGDKKSANVTRRCFPDVPRFYMDRPETARPRSPSGWAGSFPMSSTSPMP